MPFNSTYPGHAVTSSPSSSVYFFLCSRHTQLSNTSPYPFHIPPIPPIPSQSRTARNNVRNRLRHLHHRRPRRAQVQHAFEQCHHLHLVDAGRRRSHGEPVRCVGIRGFAGTYQGLYHYGMWPINVACLGVARDQDLGAFYRSCGFICRSMGCLWCLVCSGTSHH